MAIKRANHVYTTHAAEILNTSRTEELYNQLSTARYDYTFFKSHWRNVIRGASQCEEDEINEMNEEHARELAEFDEATEQSETPVKFRKYSPELLQLRRRQKAMVASKRYIEAKVIKDEADELQVKEDAANYERFREKAAADRAEIAKKQSEKLFVRRQNWDRTIHEIERIATAEIEGLARTVEHLEGRIHDKEEFARAAGWVEPSASEAPVKRTTRDKTTGDGLSPHTQKFRQQRMVNKTTYSIKVPTTGRKPKSAR
jgi:hypothetical protein